MYTHSVVVHRQTDRLVASMYVCAFLRSPTCVQHVLDCLKLENRTHIQKWSDAIHRELAHKGMCVYPSARAHMIKSACSSKPPLLLVRLHKAGACLHMRKLAIKYEFFLEESECICCCAGLVRMLI